MIDDDSLVTDELADYIHRAHTWAPKFTEARRQSVSLPHDYTPDLPGIKAPVLLIHGRYDRIVPFEVSIAILNHIADSRRALFNNCGNWPPFEKPAKWTARCWRSCRAIEPEVRRITHFAPNRCRESRMNDVVAPVVAGARAIDFKAEAHRDPWSVPLGEIDVANPYLYSEDTWHGFFARLRRE